MEINVRKTLDELASKDDQIRFNALKNILKETEKTVDWVYQVWDELAAKLEDENSYQRSIAALVLCNLVKSDTEHRMKQDIDKLLNLVDDEKFITSRQCIQNIWKIAVEDEGMRKKVVDRLQKKYSDCEGSKNYSLIRQDILECLKRVYEQGEDKNIRKIGEQLIEREKEPRYRKKYERLWQGITK